MGADVSSEHVFYSTCLNNSKVMAAHPVVASGALALFSPFFDSLVSKEEERCIWKRVRREDARRTGEIFDCAEEGSAMVTSLVEASDLQRSLFERRKVTFDATPRLPKHVSQECADELPCITASYEDSYLRPPRHGERYCVLGNDCVGASQNISGWASVRDRVLVEFRTPSQRQRDALDSGYAESRDTGLCVLCKRLAVDTAFLTHLGGIPCERVASEYFDQINDICNPVDVIDGYKSEYCLPPIGATNTSACTRLVGSVCGLKFPLLEWKADVHGKWWVDQQRAKYTLESHVSLSAKSKSHPSDFA
jgi:hypothetical protein